MKTACKYQAEQQDGSSETTDSPGVGGGSNSAPRASAQVQSHEKCHEFKDQNPGVKEEEKFCTNCSFGERNVPTAPHKRSITHLKTHSQNKVCDCHSFKVNSKRIRTSQSVTNRL